MLTITRVERIGSKTVAQIEIGNTRGNVTLYSDGSLISDPAWLWTAAGKTKSDAKLSLRRAIQNAVKENTNELACPAYGNGDKFGDLHHRDSTGHLD